MTSKYKDIPISAAQEIANKFDKDQVIIVTWDKTHGRTHVTTYGKTLEECKLAADGGNLVKKAHLFKLVSIGFILNSSNLEQFI